jgi:hypothetical protein
MPEGQNFADLQSQSSRISVLNANGLVAAKTGTTDTAVTSWTASPTTVGADSIESVQTAALGTTIRIRTAGIYRATFQCAKLGDADSVITFGFSKNVAAGGLAAAPAYATAGMLWVLPVTLPAATASTIPVFYTVDFEVTQAEARTVVSAVQGAQIRFHAFGAAGAPAAGLPATPAKFEVAWLKPATT